MATFTADMLRYIDLDQFVNEIPDSMQGLITDDNPNSDMKQNEILIQKGVSAEAEFESYVVSRYKLPVIASDGTVPEKVRQVIYTILKYNLYARRNALSDSVMKQYNDVINWLKMVSAGKTNIPQLDTDGTVGSKGISTMETSALKESEFSTFV